MVRICLMLLAGALALDPGWAGAQATDAETPLEVVAAAVRIRGHACDHPETATRDEQASEPDRAAWIITCESGRYRVIFEGDTGAQVEALP